MGYLTQNKTNRTRKQAKYFSWFAKQKIESCLRNQRVGLEPKIALKNYILQMKTMAFLIVRD
jgi:hypothetical protein